MSDSFSQVMRNPARQWGLRAPKHRFIWSVVEFPVAAGACDSESSGSWDTSEGLISTYHCKWIGLQCCQQLTWYEGFIHQHIFPVSSNFWGGKTGERGSKTFFWLLNIPVTLNICGSKSWAAACQLTRLLRWGGNTDTVSSEMAVNKTQRSAW